MQTEEILYQIILAEIQKAKTKQIEMQTMINQHLDNIEKIIAVDTLFSPNTYESK